MNVTFGKILCDRGDLKELTLLVRKTFRSRRRAILQLGRAKKLNETTCVVCCGAVFLKKFLLRAFSTGRIQRMKYLVFERNAQKIHFMATVFFATLNVAKFPRLANAEVIANCITRACCATLVCVCVCTNSSLFNSYFIACTTLYFATSSITVVCIPSFYCFSNYVRAEFVIAI